MTPFPAVMPRAHNENSLITKSPCVWELTVLVYYALTLGKGATAKIYNRLLYGGNITNARRMNKILNVEEYFCFALVHVICLAWAFPNRLPYCKRIYRVTINMRKRTMYQHHFCAGALNA